MSWVRAERYNSTYGALCLSTGNGSKRESDDGELHCVDSFGSIKLILRTTTESKKKDGYGCSMKVNHLRQAAPTSGKKCVKNYDRMYIEARNATSRV